MSHRQPPKKTDAAKRRKALMAASSAVATQFLGAREEARALLDAPDFPSESFFKFIGAMDQTQRILPRIDKKAIHSVNPDEREGFLNHFATACVTDMARRSRALEIAQEYSIALLPAPEDADDGSLFDGCPGLATILSPVKGEYPYFSNLLLGMYQSRLEQIVGKAGLLPYEISSVAPKKGSLDRKKIADELQKDIDRVIKASELLTPDRLVAETRQVLVAYLTATLPSKDRILIDHIADISVTYVVLWLACMGLHEQILAGLLGGMPVLRRISKQGAPSYTISRDGISAGLSFMETEEE